MFMNRPALDFLFLCFFSVRNKETSVFFKEYSFFFFGWMLFANKPIEKLIEMNIRLDAKWHGTGRILLGIQ